VGAGVLPLPAQNNLRGSIIMGAYPELLPGGFSTSNLEKTAEVARLWGMDLPQCSCGWNSAMPSTGSKFGVLYLIGETLPRGNDGADFVIYQNIYPPDAVVDADLVLPAASFAEVDGTFTNGEGHVQRIAKAVNAPGEALPDWQILCRIAQKMGARGFDFPDARAVHEDISSLVPGFGGFEHASPGSGLSIGDGLFAVPQMKSTREGKADKSFPLILSVSVAEHVHRGFPIAQWVGGARTLFPEGIVEVNPVDAASAGIGQGDMVVATSRSFEKTWMAALRSDLPEGTLHVVVPQREAINPNPDYVRIRKADVQGH